jgi:hypothetical protein
MITKFEKKEVVLTTDAITKGVREEISFKEVEKKDAEFIHYCGHDKVPPEPCRRVKL